NITKKEIILSGLITTNKAHLFILRIEKPIKPMPTGNYNEDILNLLRQYKAIMEDYIKKYPEQWYMFRKFWKE
ncbi:MAG: hypothetical protein NC908_04385, partial [Candidatus Omnitrophica bacterium]|nr:hypothetical protein [Candidatus Omnitrophota bacterium]